MSDVTPFAPMRHTCQPSITTGAAERLNNSMNSSFAPFGPRVLNSPITMFGDPVAAGAATVAAAVNSIDTITEVPAITNRI